jgi:glycosyltransferase involved in cell wall biosynthesis
MHVWLVQPGEPLPCDPGPPRLLRTGLLAEQLVREGHRVTWWATAFDHATKTHRAHEHTEKAFGEAYRLVLLSSPGYRTNISLSRWIDHRIAGRELRRRLAGEARPDVIHCSFPTIELAYEIARYSAATGVPYVVDARDMWPDIFLEAVPAVARGLGRLLLAKDFSMTRTAFRQAAAVTAHAPGFVDWGLAYAGRARGPLDVAFPFAYPTESSDLGKLEAARKEWDAMGVRRAEGAFNVCFFGTFADRDEVDLTTVVEAARSIADSLPQVRFILCGSGPRLERIRAAAQGSPNVILPGRIDLARIRALMERSDLGLLPYLPSRDFVISLPNKAVEYLSGSLPVLTSLSGGYLEEVLREGECGRFYEGRNASSLALAIREAVADRAGVERQRSAAGRTFENRFRADAVSSQMIEHLQQVQKAHR